MSLLDSETVFSLAFRIYIFFDFLLVVSSIHIYQQLKVF